jgi:hypothetical protein
MARYLIVAHQTAVSPELRDALRDRVRKDPDAVFALVVPATPVEHLAAWTRGESSAVAQEAGEQALERLAADGIDIGELAVGDPNPVYAVADAFNRGRWDEVIVSTLPVRVSRWVKRDVVSRIAREVEVPVTHVIAGG